MVQFVKNFWKEEEGVTAIEYGLIAALLAVMVIGGATIAGDQLKAVFDKVGTALTSAATKS